MGALTAVLTVAGCAAAGSGAAYETPFTKVITVKATSSGVDCNLYLRTLPDAPKKVWLGVGADENQPNVHMMVDDQAALAAADAVAIEQRVFEDETHASIFPAVFSTGLRHLFAGDRSVIERIRQPGCDLRRQRQQD